MEKIMTTLQEWITVYGLNIVGAIVILIVGRWVSGLLSKIMRRILVARHVEETLVGFAVNLTYATLLTFVIIAALSNLGIQTTSFIAVLGAAGLAVGFALQGSLSNFAAGVLLIAFRPFKVGDVIETAGILGVVEDLQIFNTQLRTPDNKAIVVPNGKIAGDTLINYSTKETRRLDLVFGVSYGDDLRRVKEIIWEILNADERVLKDPEPTVAVAELGDSSVNFVVRPWVKNADYWAVRFDLIEKTKLRFDDEGINIPFPQRDVHLFPVEKESAA